MARKSFKDGELQARYGQSEKGNFFVKDTIGVPHPYMIMPGHVAEAADHHGGMLGEAAIEAAEDRRIFCGICRGKLSFHEHETALLVACKEELKDGDKPHPELHAYLLKVNPMTEEDGFAGYAFVKE